MSGKVSLQIAPNMDDATLRKKGTAIDRDEFNEIKNHSTSPNPQIKVFLGGVPMDATAELVLTAMKKAGLKVLMVRLNHSQGEMSPPNSDLFIHTGHGFANFASAKSKKKALQMKTITVLNKSVEMKVVARLDRKPQTSFISKLKEDDVVHKVFISLRSVNKTKPGQDAMEITELVTQEDKEAIQDKFNTFGKVWKVIWPKDKGEPDKDASYAFVYFLSEEGYKKAIKAKMISLPGRTFNIHTKPYDSKHTMEKASGKGPILSHPDPVIASNPSLIDLPASSSNVSRPAVNTRLDEYMDIQNTHLNGLIRIDQRRPPPLPPSWIFSSPSFPAMVPLNHVAQDPASLAQIFPPIQGRAPPSFGINQYHTPDMVCPGCPQHCHLWVPERHGQAIPKDMAAHRQRQAIEMDPFMAEKKVHEMEQIAQMSFLGVTQGRYPGGPSGAVPCRLPPTSGNIAPPPGIFKSSNFMG